MAIQIALGFIADGTTEQIDSIRNSLTVFNNPIGIPLYTINGFAPDHQVGLIYLCPENVDPKDIPNWQSLQYLAGSEEKEGHSKMKLVNFLMDRFVSFVVNGNVFEAVCLLDDVSKFNGANVTAAYEKILDNKIFVDAEFGYVVSRKVRMLVGRLVESGMTFTEAVQELKNRITAGGFTSE